MSRHYAIAMRTWGDGIQVDMFTTETGVPFFGDYETATDDQITAVATARIARAGWRTIGDWVRDGDRWRVDVEPNR